jgi:predicted nuclease of predicted toxin-antitoxin system
MKLLLDQGLPRSTVIHLAANGIAAVHVSELGMAAAADTAILEAARLRQEIVVTLDAEFHQLLAVSQAKAPSVIRIRIEGLKGVALASVLNQVRAAASAELSTGAVVSVTNSKIRVRLLPIGS